MHERIAYMRLPVGWSIYWNDLRVRYKMTIREAQASMVKRGYEEFEGDTIFKLRQCEMYTTGTIPCECLPCLRGFTEHKFPYIILSEEHYNNNRERTGFYWK
jgi:hypothetical protein